MSKRINHSQAPFDTKIAEESIQASNAVIDLITHQVYFDQKQKEIKSRIPRKAFDFIKNENVIVAA